MADAPPCCPLCGHRMTKVRDLTGVFFWCRHCGHMLVPATGKPRPRPAKPEGDNNGRRAAAARVASRIFGWGKACPCTLCCKFHLQKVEVAAVS